MMDDTFIDPSSISPTERLCFMILDHLRRAEDEFDKFRKEYTDSKRIEKYNEVIQCVERFINRKEYNEIYHVIHEGYNPETVMVFWSNEFNSLTMSILVKSLSRDRIQSLWPKLYPNHTTQVILDKLDEYSTCDHTIYGFDHDSKDEDKYFQEAQKFWYDEKDIQALLNELNMCEIANITPKINCVTYSHIKLA